ncbi:MAG: hypothetical protein DCC49_11560 [Acidobacteria bacterium]|nr:MAG: hypothetical protein DCC49_11560 [Acidobacteriota bacterium]
MTQITGAQRDVVLGGVEERDLVEAAKTSSAAFARLYEAYLPVVFGYLRRRTESRELAEDLTAATFEKAIVALPTFEWRGIPFGAWLVRIASRKLTDHYRTEARRATDLVDPDTVLNDGLALSRDLSHASGFEDLSVAAGEAEEFALALEALDDIPDRYRQAISLRLLAELTTEEAAEVMGCNKATFAVLLHRGIKSLRRAVERRGNMA